MGNCCKTTDYPTLVECMINLDDFPLGTGETVKLKDDRLIGYMVYGPELVDTKNNYNKENIKQNDVHNILFFHGLPGSRLFFHPNHTEISKQRNARIFVIERPGFGLSSPKPDRTLLDFADDISEFSDILHLNSFSIVGYSAGGPYALACASKLSRKLRKVIIVSSVAPCSCPNITKNMTPPHQVGLWLSKNWKWGLDKALQLDAKEFKKNPVKSMRQNIDFYGGIDKQIYLSDCEIERVFLISAIENDRREDTFPSTKREYHLFFHNWEFDLSNIEIPIVQFSGSEDRACTPSMAKYLSETIPTCKNIVIPDKGHMLFFEIWDNILEEILMNTTTTTTTTTLTDSIVSPISVVGHEAKLR